VLETGKGTFNSALKRAVCFHPEPDPSPVNPIERQHPVHLHTDILDKRKDRRQHESDTHTKQVTKHEENMHITETKKVMPQLVQLNLNNLDPAPLFINLDVLGVPSEEAPQVHLLLLTVPA